MNEKGQVKLLVCGRPDSGKSFFCALLRKEIDCYYFNADLLREIAKDTDYSMNGRIRQAERMAFLAKHSPGVALCDFICPTPELRKIFAPDIIIYVSHPGSRRYEDTDKLFVAPQKNEAAKLIVLERGDEEAVVKQIKELVCA